MVPASIRTKNPGAMWPSALSKKWGSKTYISLNDGTGQGNKIAIFDNWVSGICAQLDLWRTSKNYRNKRFCDAIAIWSGHNHVESYISYVLKLVPGMTRNTIMDDFFWNSPMGVAFLKAQAGHEAGQKYPAPDGDFFAAQRIVFSDRVKTPPPPVKASTKAATGAGTVVVTGATSAKAAGISWLMVSLWVGLVVLAIGVGVYFWRRHEKKKEELAERPAFVTAPDYVGG